MIIEGFSKLTREQKIQAAAQFSSRPLEFTNQMLLHWHPDLALQKQYSELTENTVTNFFLPYSLAPNFLINGTEYIVPMVTEESSVVAAASAASKFWYSKGGFHTKVSKMLKPGHIHFLWKGEFKTLRAFADSIIPGLMESVAPIEKSMKKRGGGIQNIALKELTDKLENYYQLEVVFNTVDAMGANFINSCLEAMTRYFQTKADDAGISGSLEIIMSILSNYTPECIVECFVSCPVSEMNLPGMPADVFVNRFMTAIHMADADISRTATHNKGIFNGVDAVIIATGNDFRATEAAGHAWASRSGKYSSLSQVKISEENFNFSIELPMPLGITGGITSIHPLAKASLQLLGDPGAEKLMEISASAGLANHFSAIRSLITTGIQKGHMKLHLINILNQLDADDTEKKETISYFQNRNVTYTSVREFLSGIREK